MNPHDKPVTFGVVVSSKGYFNPQLATEGRAKLLAQLDSLGYQPVIPAEGATPHSVVGTIADAYKCAAVFQSHRSKIDGIIVTLPNFGDEVGVVETIARANLGVPVLVHAFDDNIDMVDVKSRRDAFCGKFSVCNNLVQYGIKWTDTTEHTCAVDGREFAADLDFFARVCRVVAGLKGVRIGAIGARPASFQTVRFSEKLLQSTGITIVPVDLSEIISSAEKIRENAKELQDKLSTIREYGTIPGHIPPENVLRQAKLVLAIERWMEDTGCAASAIQCWESIQRNYGCASCLSMSLMGERGMPSACEMDVAGAVSMYVLRLASGNAPGFLDWNNNYGSDREMCVNTHCSNYPKSFVGGEIEISELDVLGATLGRDRCFGAIKGKVKAGPMTFFRMDTDDAHAKLHSYVGEGEFTDDPFDMDGGVAVCKIKNLRKILGHISSNGFAHHIAMVRGLWSKVIHEATAKYMGWDVYWHNNAT